jgi:hypothetical protein
MQWSSGFTDILAEELMAGVLRAQARYETESHPTPLTVPAFVLEQALKERDDYKLAVFKARSLVAAETWKGLEIGIVYDYVSDRVLLCPVCQKRTAEALVRSLGILVPV